MWTNVCVRILVVLLSTAAIMLLSTAEADSSVPIVSLGCCRHHSARRVGRIKLCYEQQPRDDCNQHAFLVITRRNKQWCVSPTAKWLQDKIDNKTLRCPSDISLIPHRNHTA